MMRRLVVLTVGLTLCVAMGTMAGEDKTKPGKATVEAYSLSVYRKLDQKKFGYGADSLSMAAVVSYPGKHILGVDSTGSRVSDIRDDKDTNLLQGTFFKPSFFGGTFARDRSAVVVNTNSGRRPAKGANKVTVKGSVVLVCGMDEKTSEAKEVENKANTEAKFGDFTLKVNQEKGFGNSGPTFTVSSKKRTFKSVTVKDADGKEVTPTLAFFPQPFVPNMFMNTFSLPKGTSKMTISITYFEKEEKVTVPIDLSIGLGL